MDVSKVIEFPYSKVRFQAGVSYSSETKKSVISLAPQTLEAFAYGVSQPISGAPGISATDADTNMTTSDGPPGGGEFLLHGLSIAICPTSDAQIAKLISENCSVEVMQSGKSVAKLGPLFLIPGAAGLVGKGPTRCLPSDPINGSTALVQAISSGIQGAQNFRRFGAPIHWLPEGTEKNLRVRLTLTRPISFEVADRSEATGIQKFEAPRSADGIYADFLVMLHSLGLQRKAS